MKVELTHLSLIHPNHDTLSVFDGDGREIAIHRMDIDQLITLLMVHKHKEGQHGEDITIIHPQL